MNQFDPARIGVSTNLFNNPEDIVRTVNLLSQDFPVIELELDNGAKQILYADSHKYYSTLRKLNELRTSKKLYLSAHAPYIGADCDISANDEEIRQASCELLRRAIKFCGDLGIERLTYHPGYVSSRPITCMIDNLKRSLEKLVPEATNKGVTLCLENTGADRPRFLVFSPTQHVEISKETGTYLTVDFIHHASYFSTDGQLNNEFFEALEEVLPYVRNIHIADMVVPKHVHLPMGKGNLPVSKLLNFLAEKNYQGNTIIEEIGGGYSCAQFLEEARKYRDQYCDGKSLVPAVV